MSKKRKTAHKVIEIYSTDEESSISDLSSTEKPQTESKKLSDASDIPKKVISRRKSVHHSIKSVENLSFQDDSIDDIPKMNPRWSDTQLDDALDKNIDDPEIDEILKKIAYYRVFTNFLLRQYNMLAIDFKLYSNLDLLNLDLNLRVETYTGIQKSRQRFKEAQEMGMIDNLPQIYP